ncbi:MAG: LapA family protein [Pseudomonadota bacterium]
MKTLRVLLYLVILALGVTLGGFFAVQNMQAVPLDVLIYTFQPRSLALWILVAFALGGVLGLFVSSAYLLRSGAALRSSRRQLDKARTELALQKGRGTDLAVGD